MKFSEFVDFQWTDYEGLPMEDRLRILETYLTKSRNLFESNNQNTISKFNSLHRRAVSEPVSNKKYIMVLLALMNNEVIVSQETQIVEYISKHDNYYVVRLQDGREAEFPHKHVRDKLLMSIFLFNNMENYDLFRVDVAMFFDRDLPEFSEEDLMENYQQFTPPKKMVWMVEFIPKGDVGKQSATNRQTVRYFYKDKESALSDAQRLSSKGHNVYTPTEVSAKNMSPVDKLREAINPTNAGAPGKTKTVYFVRQKRGDSWVRIAKYSYPLKAQRAIYDLEDSYAAKGMETPLFNVERVDNYPDTMYESTPQWQKHQTPRQRVGVKNWHEIDRAYRQVNKKNPDDPLRLATLQYYNEPSRTLTRPEVETLWTFLKAFFRDQSNQQNQAQLYDALSTNRGVDQILTMMRSRVTEGKKRKAKQPKSPKSIYSGAWDGGGPGYSSGGGDGGGSNAAMEAVEDPQNTPKDSPKDEPKVQLPPAHHAQKTQIPGTLPTYQKAYAMLNDWAPQGTTLDFGAGLGIGAKYMGSDTFEPFPRPGFNPTYTDSGSIRDGAYNRVTNLNVLNVVPKDTRDNIVKEIGRILSPGGVAIITTRGKDVMGAKGERGTEPMSIITSIGTYQKGFTKAELKGYIESILGKGFEVESINLGPAGCAVRKLAAPLKKRKA